MRHRNYSPAYLDNLMDVKFLKRNGYVYCQETIRNLDTGRIEGWKVWRFTKMEYNLMLSDMDNCKARLWLYIVNDSNIEPWTYYHNINTPQQ